MKRGRQGVLARDKAAEIGCDKLVPQTYILCERI